MQADPSFARFDTEQDHYEILSELSGAAIVACYLARDTRNGEQVIVREVPKSFFHGSGFARFENEARLTATIRCENYSQPLEFAVRDRFLRGIYKFVPGVSLASRFRQRAFNAHEILLLARDLLRALQSVHQAGCVHRDIRPSNIILRDDGTAVLCGYVPLWRPDVFGHDNRLGRECASYTSPELSGIIDHDIGEPSDLYSLGYVLDAALAGGPAFDGEVSDILYKHVTADPDPCRYAHPLPPLLLQFLEKLIRKEPRDRYQTAAAALFDVEQMLAAFNDPSVLDGFVIGSADKRTNLIDPAFVGRKEQLSILEEALSDAWSGPGRQVMMFSQSGMGKSRLLTEVSRIAARRGFLLLHGRSSQHAAQEPNAPWLQMIDQLSKLIANDEGLREQTLARMESHREEVVTAMPRLAKVLGWTGKELLGPEELGQGRIVAAFRSLLTGIGSSQRSVMLTLDDCQWLDDQSYRVLADILSTDSQHVFLLAVARTNEGMADKLAKELKFHAKFHLGPLSVEAIGQLAESMAGPLPQQVLKVVCEYAEGSPFMAAAVLRGMVESSVLTVENGNWYVHEERLSNFQAAEDAGQVLAGRLSQLPRNARDLLAAGAVIGKDFGVDAAAALAGMEPETAGAAIKLVRQQRLVWSRPDSIVSFVHDKIRETVLQGLSTGAIRAMHGKLGHQLAADSPDRVFDLAFHFDAAEMHEHALPYALKAAEHARKSFSLASAQQQLRIAARAFQFAEPETRHHVEMLMSDVLLLQGEYDQCETWLAAAAESAASNTEYAKVALKWGELFFKRGNKDRAVEHYEQSLARLDQPVCQNRRQLWINLGVELLRQVRNSVCPCFKKRVGGIPTEADQMTLSLYSRLAHAYWYTRDKYYTLWSHLRGMNLAERFQPTSYLAQSYSEHAPVMTLLRWQSRGVDYANRSLSIRKQLNDVWGQGQTRNFLSILLYSFSRFNECIDQASQAVAILERTGDYWEVHIARYQLAASLLRVGRVKEAVEQARINYESALERGDYQATGNIIDVWARASFGAIPSEIIDAEYSRDVFDPQRICEVNIAKGVKEFYRGEFITAKKNFGDAIDLCERSGVANAYVSPAYPWYVSALRGELDIQKRIRPKDRRRRERHLLRAARRALRISKRFSNERPHALREYAAALAINGRLQAAECQFRKATEVATGQGAIVERALTVELHAEFARAFDWRVDQRDVTAATELLDRLRNGSQCSVNEGGSISLLDRFDSLLGAGRKIVTSSLPLAIYEEVIEAAQRILRGEQVFVITRGGKGEYVSFPDDQSFDKEMVQEAFATNSTVVRGSERILDRGVVSKRSGAFLCSPIDIGGNPVAFLYLTNTRVVGLFGDDEVRIAEYLASAAGAALEKADSFHQLQELNTTLEAKVEERTAIVVQRSAQLEKTANELRATQSDLRLAKEVAESANLAKSNFLAHMSHEIRTPITAVLGFTELLLRGVVRNDQQRTEHLRTIHTNGTHLLNLLNDILDLSKIEANRLEIEKVICNPTQLLTDIVASLRSKALQKQIELDLCIEGRVPETILTDPTRLRQIVINLVGNAIKFTDQGGVSINFFVKQQAEDHCDVVIAVRDTGIGINAAQLARVFEPFTQADTSTTRKYGGTGLGLSISRKLTAALGGELTIHSQEGEGTQIEILLPCELPVGCGLRSADEILAGQRQASKLQPFHKVDLDDVRVLVVDDAAPNRDLIRLLLTDAGAEVVTRSDGREAIDFLTHSPESVDMVLMDMQMPVLDGYEATAQLRQHGFDRPIIAMTANAMVGDDQKCRTAGCSDYLSKPLDLDRLLELVSLYTKRKVRTIAIDETPDLAEFDLPVEGQLLPNDWRRRFAIELIERVQTVLPELDVAIDAGRLDDVAEQVHWIKGTGGTVGVEALSELARQCEAALHDGSIENVKGMLEEMRGFVQQACEENSTYI